MQLKRTCAASLAVLTCAALPAMAQTKRAITLDDQVKERFVRDPELSPDGKWVAYTVTTADVEKDKRNSDLWMVSWDGTQQVQLTSSPENESSPKWSPDGRYLAFLTSRGDEDDKKKGAQIWLLNRAGGEAVKLTDIKGGVSDYAWSPDGKRLALAVRRFRSERRTGEEGRLEAQDRTADRHRPLPLQGGRERLPRAAAHASRRCSTSDRKTRHAHERQLRRRAAVVVAGRHADRVRQQAATPIPIAPPTRTSTSIEAKAGATPRAADDVRRIRRRASGVEPGRQVHRLPAGRRAELLRVQPGRSWRSCRRPAATPRVLTAALDRSVRAPRVDRRRQVDPRDRRRRSRSSTSARCPPRAEPSCR